MVRADSLVVFNEVMYHPATNESALEWVELYNQNATDVDMSGWRFSEGIDYLFPDGTVIAAGGFLVVAISPAHLMVQGVTNVVGPFDGRLSNNGEDLRLRDIGNRLMDELDYEVDGDWPVGPDGSGVSLAKRHPNLGSAPAESWAISLQRGGTPGAPNFPDAPLTGDRVEVMSLVDTWRYEDSGADLGSAWRDSTFDDAAWPSGAGLFHVNAGNLPAAKNTALAGERATYYFRGTFTFSGDPVRTQLTLNHVVDDGAVFYLNGTEVHRHNMPAGPIGHATQADSGVGTAIQSGLIELPSALLEQGPNLLAVEVHQAPLNQTNAGLRVISASGYNVSWDGNEGEYSSPTEPALAPDNLAQAGNGAVAFASTEAGNGLFITNLNDGLYGDSHAWGPAAGDFGSHAGVAFGGAVTLQGVAWSRDNGVEDEPGCAGGCTNATLGNFSVQFTLVENPGPSTPNTGNAATGWATIATVQYLSQQPGFSPPLRHRFDVARTDGMPLQATGIRIRLPVQVRLDEIEVNPPVMVSADAAFGASLGVSEILSVLPRVSFNEVNGAAGGTFFLEVINHGESAVDVADYRIVRTGRGGASFSLPSQMLGPGGFAAFSEAPLGFDVEAGELLFLFLPGEFFLLDAVVVNDRLRGRSPDGDGDWQFPALPTAGSSNIFLTLQNVAINEVMYHHPPTDPTPAVASNLTAVALAGSWRYDDSDTDLGAAWRQPGYDDATWSVGEGLLAVSAANLPAPVNTALNPGASTYYFRTAFDVSGVLSNLTLSLRTVVDDGAVFYLNGVEILRQNMPTGPVTHATAPTTAVSDAAFVDTLDLPASALVPGQNVLAVEVHQLSSGTTSSGVVLSGGGLTLVEEGPFDGAPAPNLATEPGAAAFALNSLAGYPIHDIANLNDGIYGNNNSWIGNSGSPGFAGVRLVGSHTVSGIAFGRDNLGTYTDRTLGTYTLQYTQVGVPSASTPDTGNPLTGWATVGTLNYQGTGSGLFTNPSRRHRFTFDPVEATGIRLIVPGTGLGGGTCIDELEINPPDTSGDIAFGAQLALTTTLVPATPFTESDEEWIELHNRGTIPVNLSGWTLDGGIEFEFPIGVTIPAGGFVVAARDAAALQAKWPEVAAQIFGDVSGRMSEEEIIILRDAAGNLVDRIRVHDVGYTDGQGTSLELIDPWADNGNPGVWRDGEAEAPWETVTYRAIAGQRYGSSQWREFRIGLLDRGEVLIDDVSVVRDPDGARQELIQNGAFETTAGNVHWRWLGSHQDTRIVPDPDVPGNHVLHVVSVAPARTSHNHVESTYVGNTALADGQEYEVSFRARWLRGTPQLHTSSYHQRLARVTLLPLPLRLGTPGQENRSRVPNAGPTFDSLRHEPVIPAAGETVTVSVAAWDPDDVASATLHYRVNPSTVFSSVAMSEVGGLWTGQIPGQSVGAVVQFYVSAEDGLAVTATAPPLGPDSRALFQVADAQGSPVAAHELRLIQLNADRDFMNQPTNVMSQGRLGGTLIYNGDEVFYDVEVRLKGSAAGRIRDGDNYPGYDIRFPAGHLFRGVHRTIGIDRSGRAPAVRQQHEIYVLHMFQRAGLPVHHSDLCWFIAPKTVHTGTAILQLGGYNALFVREQFDEEGSTFNFDITYEPSTTLDGSVEGIKLPVPHQGHISTDFTDLGDDPEQYRAPFSLRTGERMDDFSGVMRLCKVMGAPQAEFDARIAEVLDVDEALRVTALTILNGIGDIYFSSSPSLPHNCRLYTPTDGGPAQFLPWDMDFVGTQGATSSIYPTSSANIGKFMNHQGTRRRYLSHVQDLLQTVFNPAYMGPWVAHYGGVVGQNYNTAYISSRYNSALSQLPGQVPFAITSNGGQDFLTTNGFVTLTGTAWIDIWEIERATPDAALAMTFPSTTTWSTDIPLLLGTNLITLVARDRSGNILATDSITVTSTSAEGGLDTDGDGMPDEWELLRGLNPMVPDDFLDSDIDGLTNLEEYQVGTNPADPNSYLRLDAAWVDPDGLMLFFDARAGRTYSILQNDRVEGGTWLPWMHVPAGLQDEWIELSVPEEAGMPMRFFQLVSPRVSGE